MTDEIKTAETDVKAEVSKLEADETAVGTWVKAHWVIIAGLAGVIVGFSIGHFV
jgi:hypothetical protein